MFLFTYILVLLTERRQQVNNEDQSLTLRCITSQNGQTLFKNLAANAAMFLKFVGPFWDMH